MYRYRNYVSYDNFSFIDISSLEPGYQAFIFTYLDYCTLQMQTNKVFIVKELLKSNIIDTNCIFCFHLRALNR